MKQPPIKAIMVIGQTCSGKERLSQVLASALQTDIISMDSMKIYKGMDIGTAKAPLQDRQLIQHHMIDIVTPAENYNVSQYLHDATQIAQKLVTAGKIPLFSGGTPLYAKALFAGLFELPYVSPEIKEQATREYDTDKESVFEKLALIDPEFVKKFHINDRQRTIRALEVFYTTQKPISSLQQQFSQKNDRFDFTTIGILWPRPILHQRIKERVLLMMKLGLEQEARMIFETYPSLGTGASRAVGYQEFFPYFEGKCTLEEAIEKVIINTRQLCKHQMTWMRKFDIHWFEMNEKKSAANLQEEVITFLKQKHRDLLTTL